MVTVCFARLYRHRDFSICHQRSPIATVLSLSTTRSVVRHGGTHFYARRRGRDGTGVTRVRQSRRRTWTGARGPARDSPARYSFAKARTHQGGSILVRPE